MCKTKAQLALKRCKHFELGYVETMAGIGRKVLTDIQWRQEDEGCRFGFLDLRLSGFLLRWEGQIHPFSVAIISAPVPFALDDSNASRNDDRATVSGRNELFFRPGVARICNGIFMHLSGSLHGCDGKDGGTTLMALHHTRRK